MTQSDGPLPNRAEKWAEGLGIGIIGLLVILFACGIVMLVVLTLLGPAIGNVFSGVIADSNF